MVAQTPELAREVVGRGVALRRIFGVAALDDPSQRNRHFLVQPPDRLRLVVENRGKGVHRGVLAERPHPGRHLVQDRSEGELVGSEVHRLARRLLSGDM
jgi:hypothetical protein